MDILSLLDAKGIEYVPRGVNEYAITCPAQHMHAGGVDAHQSFNINIEKQLAGCFACGFKLNQAGLYRWLMGEDADEFLLKGLAIRGALKRLQALNASPLVDAPAEFFFPVGKPWAEDGYRGISLETYTLLEAIKVERGRYANRIAFPIWVKGELVGVDARYLGDAKADECAKYLRNKDSSCKENWLYPYDLVKAQKPKMVLLGEGIFHAINAIDKGHPALCYFGVNNFSLNKIMLLLAAGVEEVCYVRDPDKAGEQAEQRICAALTLWFKVTSADMEYVESNTDLGDWDKELIDYCVEQRHKPVVPLCLLENWEAKIVYGEKCKRWRCPFNYRGECNNEAFKKELQGEG